MIIVKPARYHNKIIDKPTCPGHVSYYVTKQHRIEINSIITPSLPSTSGHCKGSIQEPKSDPKHSQYGQKGKFDRNPLWTITAMTTGCN